MLTGSALRIASRGARGHARSALGHSRSVYTLPHDFQLFYCSAEDGKITKSLPDGRERAPLTVLLGWVGAREKTMLKYCALHHARGLDCVFLLPVWRDVLWPTERARPTMAALAAALAADEAKARPLVIHGFSMGAYMSGMLADNLMSAADGRFEQLRERVTCEIWDSPVDLDGVPFGVSSSALRAGSPAQRAAQWAIETYLASRPKVMAEYRCSSGHFWANRLRRPSLWITSHGDTVTSVADCAAVCAAWRAQGNDAVEELVFDESVHVSHLMKYPEEYENALDRTLRAVGVVDEDGGGST